MPRTLPWLTGGNKNGGTGDAASKRAIKPQPESDSDLDRTPKATRKTAENNGDIFRSSSPPTQPIRRCPSEEYLIEGFDNDDIYMMVEDEFYAVAQTFTQHLHYAEYVRQAKEAKLRNASRIQDLARATDGVTSMSEETKKKKEAEGLAERQKKGLEMLENQDGSREAKDEDDEDDVFQDDSWAGTSLYDLMTSPRKSRTLVGARGIKSSTRAAAGFVQSSQNPSAGNDRIAPLLSPSPLGRRQQHAETIETASEDDDLDVQPTTFKRTVEDIKTAKIEESDKSITPTPTRSISHASNHSIRKPEPKREPTPSPSINTTENKKRPSLFVPKPKKRMLFDDFDELPEPASNISMQEQKRKSSSIGKSANGSHEDSNLESKRSRLNEVPTFLL